MTALNTSNQKGLFYFFCDILVLGPAQWDLYILTDGALPLPAHLLSRIVANFQVSVFFCMYRLHQELLCCPSAFVDLVNSNLWTIIDTLHMFVAYVVASPRETCHWCCNTEWVISDFLHFLCIYWQHTVCLFISFLFFVHITETQ